MLVPLSNDPRDYSWGSTTLLAALQGRAPSGRPEAEVWFGDHPADPAVTPDGRPLDAWLAEEGPRHGIPGPLPYLVKLLAAASALSIQAHPSRRQAQAGFAREEAAGIPRDAATRTYRDANHKPELIVAVSEEFRALAGLRDAGASRRLAESLGEGGRALADRLSGPDASAPVAVGWALSPESADEVRRVIAAAVAARSDEFAAELAVARDLDARFPGDPGIVVALLMNLVVLRRGEGLFLPAGVLHAYLNGLGVEIMAASDNVLRGGLTPKHVDAAELLRVLDDAAPPPPVVLPRPVADGVVEFPVPVDDFSLRSVAAAGPEVVVPVRGAAIALATAGEVVVTAATSGQSRRLAPGDAVLITPDEHAVALAGTGTVFLASPGESAPAHG